MGREAKSAGAPAVAFRRAGIAEAVYRDLFFIAVVALLLWLILFPIGQMIINSFRSGHPAVPGPFTWQNYVVAYSNPLTYRMILNTFLFAGTSTLISVALAVLFAWLTERTDMPCRNLAWGLLLVPMAMPGLLFSIAWVLLLAPKIGLVNIALKNLLGWFGFEGASDPINIYSLGGMIFLDGLRGITTVFLLVAGAFRMMDPALEEAARTAGANHRKVFFKVTLPVLLPAVLAAFLYSFVSSMESFEAPLVVGMPAKIYVYSTMIYFSTRVILSYGLAGAFGVSYFLLALILVYIYQRAVIHRAERFATITGKGYRPRVIALGKWRYPALGLFFVYFLFAVVLPLGVLLWLSLVPDDRGQSWNLPQHFTLKHYANLFLEEGILKAAWNTAVITVTTATATVLLAFFISWIIVRMKVRGRFLLDGFTFLSHAVPGILVALSFIFLYLQPPFRYLGLYGTVWIISLALVTQYIAFASRATNAAITQVHRELEEAGRVLGAKRTTVLLKITLPLVFPAVAAAWIWVAAHAVRAFSVPLMLAGQENWTLSVILWHYWAEDRILPQAAALGVLLMLAITLLTLAGRRVIVQTFSQ
ncbi:MAG TPA: iron ABC transporter permease [Candidatus Acidoferrales bacterium]|nr:iron ABC transporter permease [Candidatus Acidoferrales bacterium]